MEKIFIIHRAHDGQRKTQNTGGGVDLYLPAPEINQLWRGMKQADPDLAEMYKKNPVLKLLMAQTNARPAFTAEQLQAFNAAGEGAAQ